MKETIYEPTDERCPECGGEMEFEVDVDDEFLGGVHVSRTPRGYNCLGRCGRKFHPNEVPKRP